MSILNQKIVHTKIHHEVIKITLLILLGCICSYGIGLPLVRTAYYSLIFFLFIIYKNRIFWVAFLFILLSNPLGLFEYRWFGWIVTLTSTVGITYKSMYGIAFYIKGKKLFHSKNVAIRNYFYKYYKPFAYYTVILLLWGILVGNSLVQIYDLINYLPSLLLFVVIPRLFNEKELITFNKIIFFFTLLNTLASFFDIVSSGYLIKILTFGKSSAGIIRDQGLVRITGGIILAFYSMIFALFYLIKTSPHFKKWYLWLVIISSWLFILNSATRGWMISSSFLLFSVLAYYSFRLSLSPKVIISFAIVLFLTLFFIPDSIKKNLSNAFNRLETIEAVAEGDLTAEETVTRWTERGPNVLTRFRESPIIGFGYSKVTYEFFDPHVGNHSLLLIGGIFGLAIVWITVILLIFYFYRLEKKPYGHGIFTFGLALIAIMIIHSTSRSMISYNMPTDSAFLIALFFNQVNIILNQSNHGKKPSVKASFANNIEYVKNDSTN